MKAAAGPGFALQDVPRPSIRDDEVLIRVRRAGVCGTDVHIYEWDDWAQGRCKPPFIVGHEFAGDVVEVGNLVTDVREGDRVTAEGHIVVRPLPSLPHGQRARLPEHAHHRRGSRRLLRRVHRDAGDERLAPRRQRSPSTSAASTTRWGTRFTRR